MLSSWRLDIQHIHKLSFPSRVFVVVYASSWHSCEIPSSDFFVQERNICVRHGVSERIEDGRRPLHLRAGHQNAHEAFSGLACPQGVEGSSMASLGKTLTRESMDTPFHTPMERNAVTLPGWKPLENDHLESDSSGRKKADRKKTVGKGSSRNEIDSSLLHRGQA
jgi:hypothetical protein